MLDCMGTCLACFICVIRVYVERFYLLAKCLQAFCSAQQYLQAFRSLLVCSTANDLPAVHLRGCLLIVSDQIMSKESGVCCALTSGGD
jgi:hypothetical protein